MQPWGKQENTTLGMIYGEAKGDQHVLRSWNRTDLLTSTFFLNLKDEYRGQRWTDRPRWRPAAVTVVKITTVMAKIKTTAAIITKMILIMINN